MYRCDQRFEASKFLETLKFLSVVGAPTGRRAAQLLEGYRGGQSTAPAMAPPKAWVRYSNQMMTDGRFLGHAGYGGQFLMADTRSGAACAFLSVLENEAEYDDTYRGTSRGFCDRSVIDELAADWSP